MRIAAVGTRFYATRHAGDKSFWLDLFQSLGAGGQSIHVISLDRGPPVPAHTIAPGLTLETFAATPIYLSGGPHAQRYNPESRHIGAINNYASKSLTLARLVPYLNRLARRMNIDIVHFIDNMGPAAWMLARGLRVPHSVSAITYDPRFVGYDRFLTASLAPFDRVAATSDSFRHRLTQIGLADHRLRTVRWGADPTAHRPTPNRPAAKEALGTRPEVPVVLWAGFIQQSTERDLFDAHRVARRALDAGGRMEIYFQLKPQHFRPGYLPLTGPQLHIDGAAEGYARVRAAADLLLSPMSRHRSILAPPLTWAECMMRGIPVLTTPNSGAREVLGDGQGGLVAELDDLPKVLVELVRDPDRLRGLQRTAQDWASRFYGLPNLVPQYVNFWEEILRESGNGPVGPPP